MSYTSDDRVLRSDSISETASIGTIGTTGHGISIEVAQKHLDPKKRGVWSSMHELILVTMAPSLGMLYYANFSQNAGDGGTLFQVLLAFLFVGIPTSYMQMVLGQYTHMGVFLIKRMVPIADGAGFSYCITILFQSMFSVLDLQAFMLYILLTLVAGPLQWSTCRVPNCWEVWRQCTDPMPCVNSTVRLATDVFWDVTFMGGALPRQDRKLSMPNIEHVMITLITWTFVYLLSLLPFMRLKRVVRFLAVIHLMTKGLTACAVIYLAGPIQAFTYAIRMSVGNLANMKGWQAAVNRVVVTMTLGDFSHVMMGAFASDSTKVGTASFMSGMLSFVSLILDDIMVNSALITICQRANIAFENRHELFKHMAGPLYLTMMPSIFEFLFWPRIWSMIYFVNKALAILFRVIFNIVFLQEAIIHRFQNLSAYRHYTRPIFCFLAYSIGIVFQSTDAYHISRNFKLVNSYFCQYFNVFVFATMVSYVYGVQRFCDDVHFLRNSAPNLFWKITWCLLPPTLLFMIPVGEYFDRRNMFFTERVIEILIIFSPHIGLTTHEIIKKIIERKTITLISPEPRWGPRELERRAKRRIFNPRHATKYTTGRLDCKHFCLAENRLLRRLVAREAQMISLFGAATGDETTEPGFEFVGVNE